MNQLRQMTLELFRQTEAEAKTLFANSSSNLQEIANNLQKEASKLAKSLGLKVLAQSIRVVWNPRLQTTAGRAKSYPCLIELNPKLIKAGYGELRRTMLHELAHLVAYHRSCGRNIAAHGVEWRQACADLGIANESRTHSLDWGCRRQRRKYRYTCPHCFKSIERVRPFRTAVACATCCKTYSKNTYDDRFRLIKTKL